MTKAVSIVTIAAVVGLGLWLSSQAGATDGFAAPGAIHRLTADFFNFNGSESFTAVEADTPNPLQGGIAVFRKTVFVPWGFNTLYVSLSTTGDAHGGAANCFSCKLNGAFCNPGAQGSARCADNGTTQVPGWITLLKTPVPTADTNCNDGGGGAGDCHDNSIYYQWCVPLRKNRWGFSWGPHTIEIRMATDTTGSTVFIENAHVYVDASRIHGKNRCVQAPPIL